MKVKLAKSAGFCFGVKRAIDIAFNAAKNNSNILMLGDIVHNDEVVKEIKKRGIKKVSKLLKTKNAIFLIRAHGVSEALKRKAKLLGYKIIDATCPMVKEIHRIAKNAENNGHRVIIIGDKKHDEVRGIKGQLKRKAIVIESPDKIPLEAIKKIKKACVLVQSTQNLDKVSSIVSILKKYIPELKFYNTICAPTRIKQAEIKKMPKENDMMIIIGSKTSANTKRLYQISNSLNRRSFWIESRKDLKPGWFKQVKTVGIATGASTPDYITKDVIEYIAKMY